MDTTAEKPTLLFIDDEERILRTLNILFRARYRVFTASAPQDALQRVRDEQVDVVICDQRMPLMNGSALLAKIRDISPQSVRVLLTGYSDLDAALAAVNDGEIWRYLTKPWTADGIQNTIRDAVIVARGQRQAAHLPLTQDARAGEILVIDGESATVDAVKAAVVAGHVVHQATTLTQAVEILGSRPIAVVVSEVVVNGDDMTNLLRTLKQHHPDVLSIVVSGIRDTPRLIRLINQAQVFRFLPKPIRPGILGKGLESAMARRAETRRLATVVPAEVRTEEAATDVERTLSRRIGDYLARVRARSATPA